MKPLAEKILIIIIWALSTRLFLWGTSIINSGSQYKLMFIIYGAWSFILGMNFLFKKERPRITQTIQEVPKVSILSEVKEEVKEEEKGLAYSEEEEEEMKKNLKDLGYL